MTLKDDLENKVLTINIIDGKTVIGRFLKKEENWIKLEINGSGYCWVNMNNIIAFRW
jgi:hypothetical protein